MISLSAAPKVIEALTQSISKMLCADKSSPQWDYVNHGAFFQKMHRRAFSRPMGSSGEWFVFPKNTP